MLKHGGFVWAIEFAHFSPGKHPIKLRKKLKTKQPKGQSDADILLIQSIQEKE